jgi:hypothetical protein
LISLESGAPPETNNRRRPPTRSRILAKTSLSATAACIFSNGPGEVRATRWPNTLRPTPSAHSKTF